MNYIDKFDFFALQPLDWIFEEEVHSGQFWLQTNTKQKINLRF